MKLLKGRQKCPRLSTITLLIIVVGSVVSCSTSSVLTPVKIESTSRYDKAQDGAPSTLKDVSLIANAQPKPVVRTRAGNKSPYTVLGKTYTLLPESKGYSERGYASWYGDKFHGHLTSNGDIYDMWGMTAAHKTLPIPSYVKVTNVENGRSVIVLVNDRGPFHNQRIIDLSYAAALKLGYADKGVAQVDVVDVTPINDVAPPLKPVDQQPFKALDSQIDEANDRLVKNTVDNSVLVSEVLQPSSVVTNSAVSTTENKVNNTATPNSGSTFSSVMLQVAAFKQIDNAQKLRAKLEQALSVPVKIQPDNDLTWYRVHVGPIVSEQKMSETKQLLFEQGIKKSVLVK